MHHIIEKIANHQYADVPGTGADMYFGYMNRFDGREEMLQFRYENEARMLPGVDQFFTPGIFRNSRTNAELVSFRALWADLDEGFDRDKVADLMPSFYWNTSGGNYQAVWLLRESMETYGAWAHMNKSLTYYLGADKGGWAGSKFLRVPETINWKRWDKKAGVAPRGYVVRDNGKELPLNFIRSRVPALSPLADSDRTDIPVMPGPYDTYIHQIWDTLPMSVQALYGKPNITDRSAHIWTFARLCHKMGVNKGTAYLVCVGAPWNKYEMRPHTLWETIQKAYDH